jgi:hypothetical protein
MKRLLEGCERRLLFELGLQCWRSLSRRDGLISRTRRGPTPYDVQAISQECDRGIRQRRLVPVDGQIAIQQVHHVDMLAE